MTKEHLFQMRYSVTAENDLHVIINNNNKNIKKILIRLSISNYICYHSYLAATLRGMTTVTLVHCS